MKKEAVSVFWFRRDLRIEDNRGLFEALHSPFPVLPVFIFDSEITDELDKESQKQLKCCPTEEKTAVSGGRRKPRRKTRRKSRRRKSRRRKSRRRKSRRKSSRSKKRKN